MEGGNGIHATEREWGMGEEVGRYTSGWGGRVDGWVDG